MWTPMSAAKAEEHWQRTGSTREGWWSYSTRQRQHHEVKCSWYYNYSWRDSGDTFVLVLATWLETQRPENYVTSLFFIDSTTKTARCLAEIACKELGYDYCKKRTFLEQATSVVWVPTGVETKPPLLCGYPLSHAWTYFLEFSNSKSHCSTDNCETEFIKSQVT